MNHSESTTTSWKVPWKGIVFGLVTAALALVLVFTRIAHPKEIWAGLQVYPTEYFLGALVCLMAAWAVDGVRMRILTKGTGDPVPWWEMTLIMMASNFITLVTPFAGGGGTYIAYTLYRRGRSGAHATAIVLLGGFAAQTGLALLAFTVLTLMGELPLDVAPAIKYVRWGFAIYFAILLALTILVWRGKRVQRLVIRWEVAQNWLDEFTYYYRQLFLPRGRYYIHTMLAGITYFALNYAAGFMLLSGFGVASGLKRYGVAVLLGVAPIFSPIPGGAGAAELIAYHILDESLPVDAVGTFILLWRTVLFYIPILVGGILLAYQVMRYAAAPRIRPAEDVILPDENDHNK
ncbi:MAG: UPF0104 family protein [Firmicutes bacterium]|nr:UPF0104 family protein [Bacillota bacterium]